MSKCKDLKEYGKAACGLSECIDDIQGLSTDSSSPTDTWIVTFNKDVEYENRKIDKGFIKLWMNKEYFKGKPEERIDGLNYEADVYEYIINKILDDMCPNFVRYLGRAKNCSFNDMLKMVLVDVESKEEIDIRTKNFMRNLAYIRENLPNRPSVLNEDQEEPPSIIGVDLSPLNFLMTEAVSPKTSTYFYEFLHHKTDIVVPWDVIMQVLLACKAMGKMKMVHNDLHPNNVWVEKVRSRTLTYKVGAMKYSFKSKYKVMIYDFDRSYVESLGPNPMMKHTCSTVNMCNTLVPNKDAIKFLGYVANRCLFPDKVVKPSVRQDGFKVVNMITAGNPELSSYYVNAILKDSVFLTVKVGKKHVPLHAEDFSMFANINTMIGICSLYLKTDEKDAKIVYTI